MTAPPGTHDKLHSKWCRWLQRIEAELIRAHFHQQIWAEVRNGLLARFPETDASFLMSYSRVYADSQMSCIRRIAENATGVTSLAHLITAISSNPQVITRSSFIVRCTSGGDRSAHVGEGTGWVPVGLATLAAAQWDAHFAAAPGDERLDVDRLQADLEELRLAAMTIKSRVDLTIAHLDKRIDAERPSNQDLLPEVTYADLAETLSFLGDLTNRYKSLLTGGLMLEWTPVIQGDWTAPLRASLFPSPPDLFVRHRDFT